MPTLLETIAEYEEDLLQMIADQWGLEVENAPAKRMASQMAARMSEGAALADLLSSLPEPDMDCLRAAAARLGKIPADQFIRQFGPLREMGAGKRQRERPDIRPSSVTESLFYKGLVGKAFFDGSDGPREYIFIPEEVLSSLSRGKSPSIPNLLKPADEKQVEKKYLANDYLVDHASTALAALRSGLEPNQLLFSRPDIPAGFLNALLKSAGLVTRVNAIQPEAAKGFLEAGRPEALRALFAAWRKSETLHELTFVNEICFEKSPGIKPSTARELLLALLLSLPEASWLRIKDLVAAVYKNQPDILRKGGEYDAWFVKDNQTGETISGFEHWKDVEGLYLRFMITRAFCWFGLVDLGKTLGARQPDLFRKSQWANTLMSSGSLTYKTITENEFSLDKHAHLTMGRYFPRDIRYQLSRFCEWGAQKGNRYNYRITAKSLRKLNAHGLTVRQLSTLLHKHARKPVPSNILKALARWEEYPQEAEIRQAVIISVQSAEILDDLARSPAGKYLLKRLSAETAQVEASGIPGIQVALLEMGFFSDVILQV